MKNPFFILIPHKILLWLLQVLLLLSVCEYCLEVNKIGQSSAYPRNQRQWKINRVTPHNKGVEKSNGPFQKQLPGQLHIANKTPKRGETEDFIGAAGRHLLHMIQIFKITNQVDSSPLSYDMEKDKRSTSKDRNLLREEVLDEMIAKANLLKNNATKTVIIIRVDLKRSKTRKQTTVKESMKNEENWIAKGKENEDTKKNLECEEDGQRKMQQKSKENDKNEESEGKETWPWWPGP